MDGAEVAECCTPLLGSGSGSNTAVYGPAAEQASEILYELSGHRFGGICEATVRPCADPCRCGGYYQLGAGHFMFLDMYAGYWRNECGDRCGCHPLSRVKLPGYPVVEITDVLVDGISVAGSGDPTVEYRIDEGRYLTRLADPATGGARRWPGCQRLDLASSEMGTFEVTYLHGEVPPAAGVAAARELACQLALACMGSEECQLPQGVVRVARQGVTIERAQFDLFGMGRTGLVLVDAFLGAYNPSGLRRRPTVWSPDVQQYARPV